MKLESLFVYLIVFSISLTLLGSGLFDSLRAIEPITGASLGLAAQKCSDGTVYGKCSATKPLQCSNGQLVANCTKCGCPTNTSCTSFGICNIAPSIRNPTIASADGSNLASRALNCSGLLLDSDNDNMNVTVLWSLNNASNYSFSYNNGYANGTRFSATLGGDSVSAGSWYCQITAYDGKTHSTNRSNLLQISDHVCSDGTLYNQCSLTKPRYCSSSGLINNCTDCGCPTGQSCNSTSNSCYSIIVMPQNCSDGTPSGQCSVTKPKYCSNGMLVDNCTGCGCTAGQLCNSTLNTCYIPTCSDGTIYGNCSAARPKYCSNGTIIDNCSVCDCPSGQSCNATSKACYVPMCSDGTLYNLCSATKPKFCSNGMLVDNCTGCGCLSGQDCNASSKACYVPVCSDGTAYGQCSATKPKYCSNGTMLNNCSNCGCNPDQECNPSNNSCYIPNYPPDVSVPMILSTFGTNTTAEDLNCSSQIADKDGDVMNVTVNWYKDDEIAVSIMYKNVYNGTMTSTLKSSNLSVGDWWQCGMVANDGKETSSSGFSNRLTILLPPPTNAPPHIPTPMLNSSDGTNTVTGNLNCYDTIMDPNGDKMNASVDWIVNEMLAFSIAYPQNFDSGSFFNAVLSASNLSIGDTWRCSIRLYDGLVHSEIGASNNLNIVAPPVPPAPPATQPPAGGGGGGAPPAPPAPQPPVVTPPKPAPACINNLEVSVPDTIYIPQMVTKQVSLIVTNKGTCPVSSIAADLTLPLGMKCNLYILDNGLDVNESQTISLTILPTDAPAGQYNATIKLDAPNISLSRGATLWLLENPGYVASAEGISELKVFEYIIFLILIDFVFGSVILLIWYRPKKEDEDEPPTEIFKVKSLMRP